MHPKLSPRGNWIINNTKQGKVLHIGFAGSDNEPDVVYVESEKKLKNSRFYGVDILAEKVKKLKRKNTFVADGRKLPFKENFFDCIVLAEVIEHQTDPMAFSLEAYRVLKPNGVFLVTTPNPFGIFRLLKHLLLNKNVTDKESIKEYIGFHDHKMFFDPLSIINLLYKTGFITVEWTTKNLSVPYLTKMFGEMDFPMWPFNRLETYSCFKAIK